MDKLLLSPDYSAVNDENVAEANTEVVEILQTEPDAGFTCGIMTVVTSPRTPSPIINVVSPTAELLEFLTFNKTGDREMPANPLVSNLPSVVPSNKKKRHTSFLPPAIAQNLDFFDSGVTPELQNVVASANLHCKLNLKRIAMYAHNAEYNPRRLPVLYMRIRSPCALALIFGNGKIVATGSTSVQLSHQAARRFARIIQKLGFPVKFANFKIENLVASCEVNFHIRLELLELFMRDQCVYEPELFPGLIFRRPRSRVQILIFASGSIIISGAKQHHELQRSFREIYPLLKLFKKKS